jgi:hypothetical protein
MFRDQFTASPVSSTSSAKIVFALLFLVAFAAGWTTFAGAVEGRRSLAEQFQGERWKGEARLDRIAIQQSEECVAAEGVNSVEHDAPVMEELMKICSWLKKGMTQAQVTAQMKRSAADGLSVFFEGALIPEFDCRANHRVCFIERYFPISGRGECRLNILFGDFRVLDYYVVWPSATGPRSS